MAVEKAVILNELHINQQKVVNAHKRFTALSCGRRFGKTALAINLLSETSIAGQPAGYFTPTYKLLDGTFNECLRTLDPIISRKNDHQFIELITGGRIDFWSLENEMAGRSRKYKRAIVDEAAFVKNLWDRWTEAIRPTLTDLKGDAFLMSTPKGKNDFHKIWQKGRAGDAGWTSWQMSTYENPYIDPAEIDEARSDLPELAFSQEYMAEFNENVANPFGSQFIRQCIYPLSTQPVAVYGIDLAKSTDWTVIIGMDSTGNVCYFDRFQTDWRTTKQKILQLPKAAILIDSTGVGDPITEDLQRDGLDVTGFKFSQTSKQQLMEGLQAAIHQRKISFPDGIIVSELEIFEYQFTSTGVKYSAPVSFHDDAVMALALATQHVKQYSQKGKYSFA